MLRITRLFTVTGLLLAAACSGRSSPTQSSQTPNLSGNYVGTAQDNIGGRGTFVATLAQSGSSVTGTWGISFPGVGQNAGQLSGSASGTSLTATLSPSNPTACSYRLTANFVGTRLSGTYASIICAVAIVGTFDATRQ